MISNEFDPVSYSFVIVDHSRLARFGQGRRGVDEEETKSDAAKAIQSIPAYVEVSTAFLALVPAVRDSDKINERNYTSWLARGRTMSCALRLCLMEQVSGRTASFSKFLNFEAGAVLNFGVICSRTRRTTSVIVVHSTKDRLHRRRKMCHAMHLSTLTFYLYRRI